MNEIEVIIPNLNKRFSGVTSATLAVVPHQKKEINFCQVGYPFMLDIPHLSWWKLFKLTAKPLKNGSARIFHARRNIEMVYGLILKKIFRRKIHLIFTSVAQRKHKAFTCFLYKNMDTVISPSSRSASFLKCNVKTIIPHGIDIKTYKPNKNRQKFWKESGIAGKYGIGIFGRVRPQKGLQEFVDALCEILPKYQDWTAIIIGETTPKFISFQNNLKEKIKKCGLENRFLWLDKLPFNEIPSWFQKISLTTAISHNEGFGLTCLEAMASGCAVIGTQTGAFEMVIREEIDGLIIPCKDTKALILAFEKLLSNPKKVEEMGENARQRICESFKIQQEAVGLNKLYKEILKI